MKNIFKITSLSLALLVASCADLVEKPVSLLSPDGFFKIVDDVIPTINGTYGLMASSNYYGKSLTAPLQLMSDMTSNGYQWSDYKELSPFIHTSLNSYPENIWAVSYQIISTINTSIDALAEVEESDEERRKRFIGEARFVRAITYYHLVRLFGDVPYIGTSKLGAGLDETARTPKAEVYDNIIEDLTYAFDNLSTTARDGIRSRPSKGTAAAYLASVYMTLGNWQESYNNAKWVIDNAGALNYALESDFQDLYRAETNDFSMEIIFTIDFSSQAVGGGSTTTFENDGLIGPFNGVTGMSKPIRGWSMVVPQINIYDDWDANDYRRKVSFADSLAGKGNASDGSDSVVVYTSFNWPAPHIAKHTRFDGGVNKNAAGWRSDLNYTAFRYAEVLLIAAEAANELGNTGEAVGYVNQLRSRARAGGVIDYWGSDYGSYPASASPADVVGVPAVGVFRDLVLEERRIELAFEFKRWYDIVRRDLGNQVFGPTGREPQEFFNASKHYLLPIPQTEMDRMSNFDQNPGY